jgi:glycosyltransferase involved in cell wall biosynthesis
VKTALHQSYQDIEVLVVIDGSDSEAEARLEEITDSRLRVVRLPEALGAARARNAGVKAARGDWVAFLDDDDEWLADKIERQLVVAANTSARFPVIGCRMLVRDEQNQSVWPRRLPEPGQPVGDYLFARSSLFSSESQFQTSMLLCRRAFLEMIPFRDLPRHQDWDWVIRASKAPGFAFTYAKDPLVVWHNEPRRRRISTSVLAEDWRSSLAWADGHRQDLGRRAYAGFVLTVVADMARQARRVSAAPRLLGAALAHGRPSVPALLSFLGIWLLPKNLRQRVRNLAQGRGASPGPTGKHVTQVVTQMEAGGAQHVALWLAAGLREKGYDADVWFLYTKRPAFEGEPHVRSLLPRRPTSVLGYLLIVSRLFATLASQRPDVLITHTHYANVIGQVAGLLLLVPRRIAVHHNPINMSPLLVRWLDRLWGTLPFYGSIVAISESVAGSAACCPPWYRRRIRVIENGLPARRVSTVDAQEPDVSRDDIRQSLGIPIDARVLINVGRLAPSKNQSFLVSLMPLLPCVHLVIVGEGELRAMLAGAARELGVDDRVHFTGEVSHETVHRCLRAGDVFVFPSLYEGLSLALIEAMRAGLPAVAHDIPAIRDVLAGSGTLLPLDRGQWAHALLELLLNPDLRQGQGQASRARSERFSLDRMVDEYESLFG